MPKIYTSNVATVEVAHTPAGQRCQHELTVCQYCRPCLNNDKMPSRCILNGLVTEAVPGELARLDALSKQLIQRAKAFQTVVKLGSITAKVPIYNSLQDCKRQCSFFPYLSRGHLSKCLSMASLHHMQLPESQIYPILNCTLL